MYARIITRPTTKDFLKLPDPFAHSEAGTAIAPDIIPCNTGDITIVTCSDVRSVGVAYKQFDDDECAHIIVSLNDGTSLMFGIDDILFLNVCPEPYEDASCGGHAVDYAY